MGASKRIMEMYIMRKSLEIPVSMARFANVAFSDGSLLHGFNQRIQKRQPISAPNDIKRYFVTPKESGELCLMSCLLGENRDIFFPKLSEKLHLITFADIAVRYLKNIGYEPYLCESEDEARELINTLPEEGKWPCYFFTSDTTGEKDFEEFFTDNEVLDMARFDNLGVIKNEADFSKEKLNNFTTTITGMKEKREWKKEDIVKLFFTMLPDFGHKETGKYLDNRM
jgi:FlaA1/EpsC-like NDP-sugar epimerase